MPNKLIAWLLPMGLMASLLLGLGNTELNGEEPRRGAVAMEMMERGDYIAPHIYGVPYYNKPPLHNWAIVASMHLFGKNEFSTRLPSVLGFIACGLILLLWMRRLGKGDIAWWAMMFYLTAGDLLFYATMRSGEMDLFFSFFVFVNIVQLYLALTSETNRAQHWLIAYVALACGILTKQYAPLPFHIAACGIGMYLPSLQSKRLLSSAHLSGLLVCVAIVLSYYALYSQEVDITRWWVNQFVEVENNAQEGGLLDRLEHFVTSPVRMIKIILPWSLFLGLLYQKEIRRRLRLEPEVIFMALIVLVNFAIIWLFFRSRDRYFYPLIAPLAVVLAWLFYEAKSLYKHRRTMLLVMMVMVVARVGMIYLFYPSVDDGRISDRMPYKEITDTIVQASQGAPVMIIADQETFVLEDQPMAIKVHTRQPVLPYQLQFYLGMKTGVMPQLANEMVPGQWYIVHDTLLREEIDYDIPYAFTERWMKQPLSLVRLK